MLRLSSMRAPTFGIVLLAGGLLASSACELGAKVGELRPQEDAGAPSVLPEPTDGGAPAGELTWRLHAPIVPCSIYAMAEERADALFLGCNGGRIYRFDGVNAELSLAAPDTRVVSLLWGGLGYVWAGAQSGYGPKATTQLYRFDGVEWRKVGAESARVTVLGGSATDVWSTTATEIRRFDGNGFVTTYTAPSGELRSCAFASPTRGWCTGTSGLAVAWDGTSWTPMKNVPWSAQAEVFGVEVSRDDSLPTFFYGEPITDPHGDWAVHATKWSGVAFTSYAATVTTFASYSMPRARTAQVNVGAREYTLLSVEEQYGQALVFDRYADAFRPLCGPVLAFSVGSAKTRVGGYHGLLATIVGSGGSQIALSPTTEAFEFRDLSVASDGAAWARIEDTTTCGSITERVVRFEEGRWREVAAPQPVLSGQGLAAVARDRAYTLTLPDESLVEHGAGTWSDRATFENGWSLSARARDDVWLGGYADELAHWDGKTLDVLAGKGKGRQIRQIVSDGTNVWMAALGYTKDDTDVHVYRWSDGQRTEWNLGLERQNVRIAALDPEHVWMSGSPAQVWTGEGWKKLPFEASGVWARKADEVYFTKAGDIFRWNGADLVRVHHGFIPIMKIDGWRDGAIAVGPGGLTLELAAWPTTQK